MKNIKNSLAKLALIGLLVTLLPVQTTLAATFQPRSVTLGSTAVSTSTTYKFDFTTLATNTVGSIKFLFCTTASGGCTKPSGLTTTSASLVAQTNVSSFTIVNGTDGAPYITRTAASIASATAVSITLGNITNPSATNTTFFVRISDYTSTDTTGAILDSAVVTTSTANQITVDAQVDEILAFCVYTGINCAAGGTSVDLGVLTPFVTGTGISYFDAGTNAGSGFAVQYVGPTLTSGGNTITANGSTAVTSTIGLAQFGINATGANATPAVTGSAAPSGVAPIGVASTNYGTADSFAFVASTPTTIGNSTGPANTTKYAVSYMANINSSQAAGAYTTTLTYICTATF